MVHFLFLYTVYIFPPYPLWVVLCLFQALVLDWRPRSLRVLCSILAIPRIALCLTEVSGVIPRICWSQSPSLCVTAPSAPVITGTTDAFPSPLSALCISGASHVASN